MIDLSLCSGYESTFTIWRRMPRSAGSETSEKSSSEFSAKASKSSSLQKQSAVVCTEVFDEHSSPTEDGKYA